MLIARRPGVNQTNKKYNGCRWCLLQLLDHVLERCARHNVQYLRFSSGVSGSAVARSVASACHYAFIRMMPTMYRSGAFSRI
jgi:hypothetical protein